MEVLHNLQAYDSTLIVEWTTTLQPNDWHTATYQAAEDKILVGSTLHRVLLDPENFSRYSDGVLQASMIRLCQKGELAYSLDKSVSAKFSKLILDLLSNIKSDRCEGLTEMMLAICMESISLRLTDSRRILTQLRRSRKPI